MVQWLQSVDGKNYWCMKFEPEEVVLMQKYHVAFERLTKLNCKVLFEKPIDISAQYGIINYRFQQYNTYKETKLDITLKELTKEQHDEAENTKFMSSVFKGKLPVKLWNDYTLQRAFIYNSIETKCINFNLINPNSELLRSRLLLNDFLSSNQELICRPSTIAYQNHIKSLNDPQLVLAHLYTWHLGDLFGGQQIKKLVINVPHSALEFKDRAGCISSIKALCDKWKVVETDEPIRAFNFAINLLKEYDELL